MSKLKHMGYPALIALGFLILILTGTLLLMLPFASKDGHTIGFVNALFTASSASCVTGLVVVDTFTHWTLFGQLVILAMIQVGGLGFMTVLMMFSLFLRRKIGLTQRSLMQESINTMYIGGIVRLTKRILKGTLLFEGVGAVILALRFIPDMGFWPGVYCGIFHSISAFCNAGFDVLGRFGEYTSLTRYVGDPAVSLTVMTLVVVGGVGFFVWEDICVHKLHFHQYKLHTKIVLIMTAMLIAIPTVMFFFMEKNHAYAGLDFPSRILASMFSAITPRTAGFNTTDVASLSPAGRLLTIILMFIGGSPGSTAGGIKTTTVAVLFASVIAGAKNRSIVNIFGRRLEDFAFRRAAAVTAVNLTLAVGACMLICIFQPGMLMENVLFETFSAIGTVGMSMGITSELSAASRMVISLLMYCGRVGSLSFALVFTESRKNPPVLFPVERVNIG
ncbi:MAG: potassium transporter TrkG [Oscillospiraceae bacterium]|nr:potassium transporter TrkG [Oscillospiraceae bacterium]